MQEQKDHTVKSSPSCKKEKRGGGEKREGVIIIPSTGVGEKHPVPPCFAAKREKENLYEHRNRRRESPKTGLSSSAPSQRRRFKSCQRKKSTKKR